MTERTWKILKLDWKTPGICDSSSRVFTWFAVINRRHDKAVSDHHSVTSVT